MCINKIKVLLFAMNDNKFYDGVYNSFISDGRYSCKGVLFLNDSDQCLINDSESLKIIRKKQELIKFLRQTDYDLIYFFSMDILWWKIIDYVPLNKIIVWWAWGYDIYEPQSRGVSPLYKLPLYKHLTNEYIESNKGGIINDIKNFVKIHTTRYYYEWLRKKNMCRITYFQPVLSEEYRLLIGQKTINAEEFYSPQRIGWYKPISIEKKGDDIQIGNSSSCTNNHLDVWQAIKQYIPSGRKVIIPLSYGDRDYANYLKKRIVADDITIEVLDSFMPYEDYSKIISNCSYAVYGVIRQQAVGNIRIAIRSGIKLFFYKDSIVYKHLKNKGYCVFAIEDIDESSFKIPLTIEQQKINADASLREYNERKAIQEHVINRILSEI